MNVFVVGLGLHAVEIVGDGNCLFRSFADQMTGDQTKHAIFRDEAVEFMRTHKEVAAFLKALVRNEMCCVLHQIGL